MDDEMQKNKLKMKIKLEEPPRVCNICFKEFSTRKALGGHMRVHVQENKLESSKKPNQKSHISPEKSPNLSEHEKSFCHVCSKEFPSLKSLCGHMRCHPERHYRGIVPPKNDLNVFSSSSSSVYDEMDISTMPSWNAKAKRGRRSPKNLLFDDDFDEEDKQAVFDLMLLCEGEYFDIEAADREVMNKKRALSLGQGKFFDIEAERNEIMRKNRALCLAEGELFGIEGGSNGLMSKSTVLEAKKRIGDLGYGNKFKLLRINESVNYEGKGKGKEKGNGKVLDGNSENGFSGDEFVYEDLDDESVFSDDLLRAMMLSMKSVKKKPKFRDLNSVDKEDYNDDDKVMEKRVLVSYKCSSCNKCFLSPQALGGHRSKSHSKAKFPSQLASSTLESELVFGSPKNQSEDAKESHTLTLASVVQCSSGSVHQCKICDKVFLTGQALGGHQRTHWAGSADGQGSSHGTYSPGEEASRTRGLVIDLNELPPSEEDGGVESQNHAGYASLSHNSDV